MRAESKVVRGVQRLMELGWFTRGGVRCAECNATIFDLATWRSTWENCAVWCNVRMIREGLKEIRDAT
jgi:hypothetical protein